MDKYEYRVKTEQMLDHLEKKEYKEAMEIADSIEWRRVKNASMLNTVSEIYEHNGEFQKGREVLLQAFDRAPGSRKIVYRLGTLALKIKDVREATDCYEEFVKLAPKDPNQYILKYKILRTQGAPVSEQIAALEEFKKAEYIEKWAYELAKLYDEAGMTAECLEECDDLILWFSEGKYVYLAMELKMKYKPLTPLQQEKYDSRPGAVKKRPVVAAEPPKSTLEEVDDDNEYDEESESAQEPEAQPEVVETEEIPPEEVIEPVVETAEAEVVEEPEVQEEHFEEAPVEEAVAEEIPEEEPVVEEAVAEETVVEETPVVEEPGESVAQSINIEEKAMKKKEDDILAAGQMMIDDILMKWEAKQKDNEEAIAKQKAKDEERLQKEREQARIKEEEERKEVERKAAEAEAARKAAEEEARRKAEEEAARKAAEEAAKKAAEEEAARKAAEEAAKKAAEEEAARKAAEEAAKKAAEEEAAKKAAEEEAARKAAEEEAAKKAAEEEAAKAAAQNQEADGKTRRIPDDIVRLMEQMESEDDVSEENFMEDDFEEISDMEADFIDGIEDELDDMDQKTRSFDVGELKEATGEDDFDEADFEEAEFDEDEFEEADFDEADFEEADFDEADFEEADFQEASEAENEENNFQEAEDADFEEVDEDADFREVKEDEASEDDFEEADDFEDDFQDVDDAETDFEDDGFEADDFAESNATEDEFDEDDFDEDEFDEDEFDEDEFDEDEFEEDSVEEEPEEEEEEELVIEEPSEEEIQERIRKSKGMGVPFDTGFVVTGRYDLSATSEIGLKAGLTEEQKKLFSYFVPVRGMSEQIVEVLDNDRRAQREGTSKTGNLMVIGRKGSGKTVLAVDIVKAIQKQRNLKQGKVAIVTGESLNKKELTNIIQKLRGGAIIIEGAGKLNSRTVKELNYLMEKKTGELLFVLEDQRKPLERLMTANPDFRKKFSSRLELPVFINDELVTFGQTYAKENGYKLDEMGILALYSRIDVMQREDHAVSVAEVKEIMDGAISHSQRANVKHLARRVFGKGTDSSDRIILKEEDFRI